jgi:hypothetical protein
VLLIHQGNLGKESSYHTFSQPINHLLRKCRGQLTRRRPRHPEIAAQTYFHYISVNVPHSEGNVSGVILQRVLIQQNITDFSDIALFAFLSLEILIFLQNCLDGAPDCDFSQHDPEAVVIVCSGECGARVAKSIWMAVEVYVGIPLFSNCVSGTYTSRPEWVKGWF